MKKVLFTLFTFMTLVLVSCDFNSKYQGHQNLSFNLKALKLPKDIAYQTYDVTLKFYEGSNEVYNNATTLEVISNVPQPINFFDVPEGDFQMELSLSRGGFNWVHIVTDASILAGPNFVELNQADFNGGWVDEAANTITQGSTISASTTYGSIALDSQYDNAFSAAIVSPFDLNYEVYINNVTQMSTSALFNSGTWNFYIFTSVTDGDNVEIKFSPANPTSQQSVIDSAGGPGNFADYRLKFTYGP